MSLKDSFRFTEIEAPAKSIQAPKRLDVRAAERAPLALQGTAKRSHPDFEKTTLYIRKATKKAAWRKWQDAGNSELSDLVQMLLERYAEERR